MVDASSQLIDDHVSVAQAQKAVTALLHHVHKEQQKQDDTQLLPAKEQLVWLVMIVKRMQPSKNLKPYKIPIVHPLVDPRTTSVCLITKDPQREYKDLLESHNIKFISRVVGVQKLKGKFKGFDARRLLLRENGLFLADERVVPLLPGLLGKKWFEAKKQPIPVSLTKKDLKGELEKAISSTYMHQNQGTCTSIKIATDAHKDSQVLANLQAAIPAAVGRIHGGWSNLQSLNIKTSNSVSLPIWTCPLGSHEPESRWAGMVADDTGEWGGFGDADVEVSPVEDAPKINGKKRAADAEEKVVDESAKKKVKKSQASETSTVAKAVEPTATPSEGSSAKAKNSTPKTKAKASTPKAKELNIVSKELGPKPKPATKPQESMSKPKKSRTPVDADQTTPRPSALSSKARKSPISEIKASPSKPLTETRTFEVSEGTGQPSSKKTKKKRNSTASTTTLEPVSSNTTAEKPSTSKKKKSAERTLSREEMKEKKEGLKDAKLEKKKEKLRETEKSARKGVKATLVGRIKA